MNNQVRKLLFDVVESGRSIRSWCTGRTYSEYQADRQFRRAVEREFEVIGEALNRIVHIDPSAADRVSQISRIIGFRNRIIHGYDTVDDAMVWGVVEGHLPQLLAEVEALFHEPQTGDHDPSSLP